MSSWISCVFRKAFLTDNVHCVKLPSKKTIVVHIKDRYLLLSSRSRPLESTATLGLKPAEGNLDDLAQIVRLIESSFAMKSL